MKTYTQMKSIQNFNKKALLGALVAAGLTMASTGAYALPAENEMSVNAVVASSCSISNNGALNFGSIAALNSMAAITVGTTVNVACTTGTTTAKIYSISPRELVGPGTSNTIPFTLSQTAGGTDLASTSVGETMGNSWSATGAPLPVAIYGTIPAGNLDGKIIGSYTTKIVMSVAYQ